MSQISCYLLEKIPEKALLRQAILTMEYPWVYWKEILCKISNPISKHFHAYFTLNWHNHSHWSVYRWKDIKFPCWKWVYMYIMPIILVKGDDVRIGTFRPRLVMGSYGERPGGWWAPHSGIYWYIFKCFMVNMASSYLTSLLQVCNLKIWSHGVWKAPCTERGHHHLWT